MGQRASNLAWTADNQNGCQMTMCALANIAQLLVTEY